MTSSRIFVLFICTCIFSVVRSETAAEMCSSALASANAHLNTIATTRASYIQNGMDVIPTDSYQGMKAHNNYEAPETKAMFNETTVCVEVAKVLSSPSYLGSFSAVMSNPEILSEFETQVIPGCVPPPAPYCDPSYKYRSIDGTCNNLNVNKRFLGSTFTAQSRYMDPEYDDDFDEPRKKRFQQPGDLPSARVVSNILFELPRDKVNQNGRTMMLFIFGQFLDHDLVLTPTMAGPNGEEPTCCGASRPECFDIAIPENDSRFTSTNCMELVRSSPTSAEPCKLGRRQQINQSTHFIDGSTVYGSTNATANSLRAFVDGKLLTREGNVPPNGAFCLDSFCALAGDQRSNELPTLTSMHTLFLREHNRIAEELAILNPHWQGDDEKLFQESRRIVGAMIQKIVYEEYIPLFLNEDYLQEFNLMPNNFTYDENTDPSIRNVFAAAVFRMGHSQVTEQIGKSSPEYVVEEERPLNESFFRPQFALENPSTALPKFARYFTSHCAAKTDGQLVDQVRDELFRDDQGHAFDLGALNVQRGRDHGLPSYNEWRVHEGLSRVLDFTDGPDGLVDQVNFYRPKLEETYDSPEDIDLYIGGLSEAPIPGGELGPLFSKLFAKQFRDLKQGDRFFYENTDPTVGFTEDQLRQLKRYSFAKIMCDNFNLDQIQPDIFTKDSDCNPLMPCSSLPGLNLKLWKEPAGPPKEEL